MRFALVSLVPDRPTWRSTQAQIDAIRSGWWCGGKPMVLVEVSLARVFAIDFHHGQPARSAAAGERRRIDALEAAFRAGAPMKPMIGYPHPGLPGRFQAQDGNHRVAAARRVGITRAPMLVCEGHVDSSMARMKAPTGLLGWSPR